MQLYTKEVTEEAKMRTAVLSGLAMLAVASIGWAQEKQEPDNRIVFGPRNEYLARGAEAIRAGLYDEGVLLTKRGLDLPGNTAADRAAGLSNLCGAYAAMNLPDTAIVHCTEALAINDHTWQAFSNRSYAYWIKGMYAQAESDLKAAAELSPNARQIAQIRGMINESGLRPLITVEDLQ